MGSKGVPIPTKPLENIKEFKDGAVYVRFYKNMENDKFAVSVSEMARTGYIFYTDEYDSYEEANSFFIKKVELIDPDFFKEVLNEKD